MAEQALLRAEVLTSADLPVGEGFACRLAPPMARFILRGDAAVAAHAGSAFGAPVPLTPLASGDAGARAALWLGPDEWLLLAPGGEPAAMADRLSAALDGLPYSLVDVSHRQIALILEGRLAARILTSGCPLDLSLRAFPVGMVARTVFHKAEIVLWRRDGGFHVEVWRSFAPYVVGHLAAAMVAAQGLPEQALP